MTVSMKMNLQLIKISESNPIIICPKAQPIEHIIGVEARITLFVTSAIDKKLAL